MALPNRQTAVLLGVTAAALLLLLHLAAGGDHDARHQRGAVLVSAESQRNAEPAVVIVGASGVVPATPDDDDATTARARRESAPGDGAADNTAPPDVAAAAAAASAVVAGAGAMSGWCTRGVAPGEAPTDVPQFNCPIMADLATCGVARDQPQDTSIKLATVDASLKAALASPNKTHAVAHVFKDACRWEVTKSTDIWTLGDHARKAVHLQSVVDCTPKRPLPATTHHLPTSAARWRNYTAWINKHVRYPTAGDSKVSGEAATHPIYIQPVLRGPSVYTSKARSSYFSVENICMTCDDQSKPHWSLDHSRPCQTTLWTVNGDKWANKMLAAASNKGRHKIFKDREGGFQYGGQLGVLKNVSMMRGTTFFLMLYGAPNVGHIIHDAAWAPIASMLARSAAKYKPPFHAMIDPDHTRHSNSYYTMLVLAGALGRLGKGDGRNTPRGAGLSRPLLLNPTATKKRLMLCFENAVFGGIDRNGNGAFWNHRVSRFEVAGAIRADALRFAGVASDIVDGTARRPPQLYVYGRSEVYRRSVDNIGALASAMLEVTTELGLPDPIVISSFYAHPEAQVELMSRIDMLLSVQGAHLEQALFMPKDSAVLEFAQCFSRRTSFISRYGAFHEDQVYKQDVVCHPRINLSDKDKRAQNLTLCPRMIVSLQDEVRAGLRQIMKRRGFDVTKA